jgi:nucleoside-diphosphate-sugar epimerase
LRELEEEGRANMETRRILVTGGPGTIGRRLILRLLADGYEIESVDRRPWPDAPVPHRIVELQELGETIEAVSGFETVIHLAAVREGSESTSGRVFQENIATSFNVFWAAKLTGVKRVLWASSSHATGQPYGPVHMPSSVPLTASDIHPVGDTYGLSKTAAESMMAHRRLWGDLQLVAMRIGFAYEIDDYEFLYENDLRRVWANPRERLSNLWGYVDGRDVHQAFKRAIEAEGDIGGEILLVTAADTFMNRPTRELVAEFVPQATVDPSLAEFGSFYSLARSGEAIGYVPEHSWRDVVSV